METGKKIRELRIENGLKQKDLAQAVHIAANTLSQFEAGKAGVTSKRKIRTALARRL